MTGRDWEMSILQSIQHGLLCMWGYSSGNCLNVNSFIHIFNWKLQTNEGVQEPLRGHSRKISPHSRVGQHISEEMTLELKFVTSVVTRWKWQEKSFLLQWQVWDMSKGPVRWGRSTCSKQKEGLGLFRLLRGDGVAGWGTKFNQRSR